MDEPILNEEQELPNLGGARGDKLPPPLQKTWSGGPPGTAAEPLGDTPLPPSAPAPLSGIAADAAAWARARKVQRNAASGVLASTEPNASFAPPAPEAPQASFQPEGTRLSGVAADAARWARQRKMEAGLAEWNARNETLNPDARAEVLRYAAATGVHPDLVAANLQEYRKKAQEARVDFNAIARDHPVLAKLLADPHRGGIMRDDTENASWWDRTIRGFDKFFSGTKLQAQQGYYTGALGRLYGQRAFGDLTPEQEKELAKLEKEQDALPKVDLRKELPTVPWALTYGGYIAGQQASTAGEYWPYIAVPMGVALGLGAPVAPVIGAGAAVFAGAGMVDNGLIEAGMFDNDIRKKFPTIDQDSPGLRPKMSALVGVVNGSLEAITYRTLGLLPNAVGKGAIATLTKNPVIKGLLDEGGSAFGKAMTKLVATAPGRAALVKFFGSIGQGMIENGVQEFLQEVVPILGEILLRPEGPSVPEAFSILWNGKDPLTGEKYWERAKESGIGGVAMGFTGGIVGGIGRASHAYSQAFELRSVTDMYGAMADKAVGSKVADRMPEVMQDYVKTVVKENGGEVTTFYAPAEKVGAMFQSVDEEGKVTSSMPPEEIRRRMPEVARQLEEAQGNPSAEIAIPAQDFVTYFLRMPAFKEKLMQDVRPGERGLTIRELKQAEKLAKDIAAMSDEERAQVGSSTMPDGQRKVFEAVYEMMVKDGKPSYMADAVAKVTSEVAQTRAVRTGINDAYTYWSQGPVEVIRTVDDLGARQTEQPTVEQKAERQAKLDAQTVLVEEGRKQVETLRATLEEAKKTGDKQAINKASYQVDKTRRAVRAEERKLADLKAEYGTGEVRGSTEMFRRDNQAKAIYHILFDRKNWNYSTPLHEFGHVYLEWLRRDADGGHAPSQAEMDVLNKWVGATGNKWETAHMEKFARGFETYLYEGNAPSKKLASIFQEFKAWLRWTYRAITRTGVTLDDDVRGVMNRMLATDEAIAEAAKDMNLLPLFENVEEAGELTGQEHVKLKNLQDAAYQEVRDRMDALSMKEAKRAFSEEGKRIEEEVRRQMNLRPEYNLASWLATGKRLDGAEMNLPHRKLDPESIAGFLGRTKTEAERIKQFLAEKGGDGYSSDELAPYFGYRFGTDLVRALYGITDKQKWEDSFEGEVKRGVDSRLGQMYPGYAQDPAWLQRNVERVISSSKVTDFIAMEAELLDRKNSGQVKVMRQAMKIAANAKMGSMTYFDANPSKYRRAAGHYASQARKALVEGNRQAARMAKQQQMWNMELMRSAAEAREKIDLIGEYLGSMDDKEVRAILGKAGWEYEERIDALLEGISFKKRSENFSQKLARTREFIEEQQKKGEVVLVPPEVMSEAFLKNYREMTLSELKEVQAAVGNLFMLAKLKDKLIYDKGVLDYEATVQSVVDSIKQEWGESYKQTGPDANKQSLTWKNKVRDSVRAGRAEQTKVSFIVRALDGNKTAGLLHQLVRQPFIDAEVKESALSEKILGQLQGVFKEYTNRQQIQMGWLGHGVEVAGFTLTRAEMLALALNMGNEGNIERIEEGYKGRGWTREKIMASLNEHMTEQDWKFVREVWSAISSLRPEVEAIYKNHTGLTPEWVEPVMVHTKYGSFEGGYYPIVYDRQQKWSGLTQWWKDWKGWKGDMADIEAAEGLQDAHFGRDFAFIGVKQNFLKKRSGGPPKSAPIKLSLGVVPNHVAEVIHYVTHFDAVKTVDKLLGDERVSAEIVSRLGPEMYEQFRPWLQSIARQNELAPTSHILDKTLRHMRLGASSVLLGLKLTTGIVQVLGLFPTAKYIGVKYVGVGIADFMKSLANNKNPFADAYAMSPHLKSMDLHWDREIANLFDQMSSGFGVVGDLKYKVASFSLIYLRMVQGTVNAVTWYGAYEKAVAENHPNPVGYADETVIISQSSGKLKDLSEIQRGGELKKLFTVMFTYWNTLFGQLTEPIAPGQKTGGAKAAQRMTEMVSRWWWFVALPVIFDTLLTGAGPKEDEREDKEKWAQWLFWQNVLYSSRSIVLVGDLTSAYVNRQSRMAPWLESMFKSASAGKAVTDRIFLEDAPEITHQQYRNLVEGSGYILHLPTAGLANLYEWWDQYSQGNLQEPAEDLLLRRKRDWR